ncbi:MAG: hypothetical protein B6D56_05320 [Candidatus Omnitrophica bacterium 4484_70.1]|nr:MAG: hypothetical protein B6D56_05320 [Candidatus Omnitrophica bacterium 4484_70.1]
MGIFKKKKLKVGLALGSGAARGLAHIGVLKALREEGIPIDYISGSSMGALVGAYFASKGEVTTLEEMILGIDWKKLARLIDPNLIFMLKGLIHGQKIKELLEVIIGDVEFKDLKIPLTVVATDTNTGEEVIIKEGSVIEAVRASISMPAIFMPVKYGRRFLIDGGVVNPVPAGVVRNMGATFVIACNVIQKLKDKRMQINKKKTSRLISKSQVKKDVNSLNGRFNRIIQKNKFKDFWRVFATLQAKIQNKVKRIDPNTPNIFEVLLQSVYLMEYEIAKLKAKEADIVITPNVSNLKTLDFYQRKEAIVKGFEAAKKMFPNIRKLIKSL